MNTTVNKMKKLQIRTRKHNFAPLYANNLNDVILFLRHEEDKIKVTSAEQVNIEIYDNGKLIFSGTKEEFFNKLKS